MEVHKQEEHNLQHSYISHSYSYISRSDTLVGTILIFPVTYVGMAMCNVAMLGIMLSLIVTTHRKTDHFTHFMKIELLVSLECAFDNELIGAFDAAIRRFIVKL